MLLRLAALLVFFFFVMWTMVFPLATLVSLAVTLPLFLLIGTRLTGRRVGPMRRSRT